MTGPTNLRDFRRGAARVLAKRAAETIVDPVQRAEKGHALQFVVPPAWPKEQRAGFETGIALMAKVAIDYAQRLSAAGRPNVDALAIADLMLEAGKLAEAQSKAIDEQKPAPMVTP